MDWRWKQDGKNEQQQQQQAEARKGRRDPARVAVVVVVDVLAVIYMQPGGRCRGGFYRSLQLSALSAFSRRLRSYVCIEQLYVHESRLSGHLRGSSNPGIGFRVGASLCCLWARECGETAKKKCPRTHRAIFTGQATQYQTRVSGFFQQDEFYTAGWSTLLSIHDQSPRRFGRLPMKNSSCVCFSCWNLTYDFSFFRLPSFFSFWNFAFPSLFIFAILYGFIFTVSLHRTFWYSFLFFLSFFCFIRIDTKKYKETLQKSYNARCTQSHKNIWTLLWKRFLWMYHVHYVKPFWNFINILAHNYHNCIDKVLKRLENLYRNYKICCTSTHFPEVTKEFEQSIIHYVNKHI